MFDFIQNNQIAIKVILGVVALTFVGFGVGSYTDMTDTTPYLVKVDGHKITRSDIEKALDGQKIDANSRQNALQNLIERQLILADAHANHSEVSKVELRNMIATIPAFQANGKFSIDSYKQFLANRGMSAEQFEALVAQDITLQNQLLPYMASNFVSKTATQRLANLFGQTRVVQAVILPPQGFASKVSISDKAIDAYYKANLAKFKLPEEVKLQYVVLSQAQIAQGIQISDQDAQNYFNAHRAEFGQEERRVAHILLTVPEGASPAEKAKIKAEAEALLKQLQQHPSEFAALAKAKSQDPGSAAQGGDLGYFKKDGMMVKPFEDAAFALKKSGDLSGVVQTQFGYHILKLEDVREPDFASVKAEIIKRLQEQKAGAAYRKEAEKLNDISYQQANSLKPTADALKLSIQSSDWLAKDKPSMDNPILGNKKVILAAFSADVLKAKHNSEPIDIGNNTQVVVRVEAYKAAKQQTLAEVTPFIKSILTEQEGAKLALKEGSAMLAKLQQGKPVDGMAWMPPVSLNRQMQTGLPPDALNAIFAAPTAKLPSYAGLQVQGGAYAIFKVEKVENPKNESPEQIAQLNGMMGQMMSEAQVQAYLKSLEQKYKVTLGNETLNAQ